jgi:hypothetical protein
MGIKLDVIRFSLSGLTEKMIASDEDDEDA